MEKFFGEIDGCGFETLDKEFESCLTGHGRVERLWTGARWVEGPYGFQLVDFFYFLTYLTTEYLDGMKQMAVFLNLETLLTSQTGIREIFKED